MTSHMSAPPVAELTPAQQEAAVRRVRTEVLERIAHEQTPLHLTVQQGDEGWQPFLQDISMKLLYEDGNTLSYLLRLAPGAVLPAHRHVQDEECMVLEGELRIGDSLTIKAGGYHLARGGVLHAPITSAKGALIFLRGAAPESSHFL